MLYVLAVLAGLKCSHTITGEPDQMSSSVNSADNNISNQNSMSVFLKLSLIWIDLMNGKLSTEEYKLEQWNLINNYQKGLKDD